MMYFTRAMIDLVKQIRHTASPNDKRSIKLADPELFNVLVMMYHASHNSTFKALITELFSTIDGDWLSALDADKTTQSDNSRPDKKYATIVYRGQTRQIEIRDDNHQKKHKPVRIYRGQIVA